MFAFTARERAPQLAAATKDVPDVSTFLAEWTMSQHFFSTENILPDVTCTRDCSKEGDQNSKVIFIFRGGNPLISDYQFLEFVF